MSGATIGVVLLVSFAIFLLIGCPIAISLGLSGAIAIILTGTPLVVVATSFFNSAYSFSLMAIPLFIFAGAIMEIGGISSRLIRLFELIMGRATGALGAVTIIVCMLFAAICGSGPATVAALGGIMLPKMIEQGYDRNYCGSLLASGGAIGVVIPPSIILIVFGCIAGPSIAALFMASVVPGILMGISFLAINLISSKKHGYSGNIKRGSAKEIWNAFKDAFWGLLTPVIIFGGIFSGIFTPTESAGIACLWGIIVSAFIYKEINFKQFITCCHSAAVQSATIMIIVGCSALFAWVLSTQGIATSIANAILGVSSSKVIILLCVNIILLIAGCFMVSVEALYIFCPIVIPIAVALGIDLVHLGIIMNLNLAIGLYTPPVGVNLYVAGKVADTSVKEIMKKIIPFVVSAAIVLVVITYIPELSLWLPKMTGLM